MVHLTTPKHGSWLTMAEIELAALSKQCLGRRIASHEELHKEVATWTDERNESSAKARWQFTTGKGRNKPIKLYILF